MLKGTGLAGTIFCRALGLFDCFVIRHRFVACAMCGASWPGTRDKSQVIFVEGAEPSLAYFEGLFHPFA